MLCVLPRWRWPPSRPRTWRRSASWSARVPRRPSRSCARRAVRAWSRSATPRSEGSCVRSRAAACVIEFEGQPVELRLPRAQPAPDPAARCVRRRRPPPRASTLERRELERRLGERDLAHPGGDDADVPVQSGRAVTGFTLSRIPDGTILSDAGLQRGRRADARQRRPDRQPGHADRPVPAAPDRDAACARRSCAAACR